MMPTHTRSPLGNPPPDLDESSTPSPVFTSSFDRATLEATVPFADRSIFVAPNGRRFLFESIDEGGGVFGRGSGKAFEDGSRLAQSAAASAAAFQGRAPGSATHPNIPRDYSNSAPPSNNPPPIRRRPVSNTSSSTSTSTLYASSVAPTSGGGSATQPGDSNSIEPKTLTQEVIDGMGNLSINRFSATPFYTQSDGGVQAAETLTDPHPVPVLPIPVSPTMPAVTLASTSMSNYYAPRPTLAYADPNYAPHVPVLSGRLTEVTFGYHQPPPGEIHELEHPPSQVSIPAQGPGARQSLPEHSMPISPVPSANPMLLSPPSPRTTGGFQNIYPSQPDTPYGPPLTPQMSQSPNYLYTLPPDDTRRTNGSFSYSMQDESRVVNDTPFDTQTPVVVVESTIDPSSGSSRSDGASTNRDNVLPGEDILYDGRVNLAQSLSTPFVDGSLKVFRNLSNDLRFHCKVGYGSETYWMKGAHAQIVPVYAYDQRFPNVLYVRDNDNEKRKDSVHATPDSGRPSEVYQFARFQELCEFQAKLTGEKVVLDISSVKLIRLSKAHSRSSETFSSVRVQIWHEEEGRRSSQSDVASFVTAGTTLSGPLRDRLVPSSSRLIVFLGRLGEYITVFITDDIELVAEGQKMAKIKPRKSGGVFRRGLRWAGVKAHRESRRGSEPAGLSTHGHGLDPETSNSSELYEMFELEFESSPSQDNFLRKWNEVLKERRLQRKALDKIHEDIRHATFSAKTAREIW